MHQRSVMTPRRCALAMAGALLMVAATAQAQEAISVTLLDNVGELDTSSVTFNLKECQEAAGITLDVQLAFLIAQFPSTEDLDFVVKIDQDGGASCNNTLELDATEEENGCRILEDRAAVPSTTSGDSYVTTIETTFDELFDIDARADCEDQDASVTLSVVAERVVEGAIDKELVQENFQFILKTARPDITPPELSVSAGESSVTLSFTAVDGASTYNLYFSESAFEGGGDPPAGASRQLDVRSGDTITSGIKVNRTYTMALAAVDDVGNESLLGETITVTTVPTLDFYEQFRNAGGTDPGGFCTVAAPASPARGAGLWLAALALGAALIARRRLRRGPGLGAACAALVLASVALVAAPNQASAQFKGLNHDTSGAFELRLGAYLPEVDGALSASPGPYESAFGNESMFLTEIELDSQFYRGFGTAAVGFTFGLMEVTGKAITSSTGEQSVDKTDLNILPLRLSLVYRFDVLATDLDFPLVPVFKAGLDYYIWWINSGQGKIATAEGDNAVGATMGWHASMGLHLLLDWFDEVSADALLFDFGIVNTYLFADLVYYQVDDFGSKDSFDFSEANAMFGIAFEY